MEGTGTFQPKRVQANSSNAERKRVDPNDNTNTISPHFSESPNENVSAITAETNSSSNNENRTRNNDRHTSSLGRRDVTPRSSVDSLPIHNVVIPVDSDELSRETFTWYLQNLHLPCNFVHICHVPDFRTLIGPGMTPMQVMEVMMAVNAVSDHLKKTYDTLLSETKIKGKFMRVGGSDKASAITLYCKTINAKLIVLSTEAKPGRKIDLSTTMNDANATPADSKEGSRRNSLSDNKPLIVYDSGPSPETLTHTLLERCSVSAVVYRRCPEIPDRKSFGNSSRQSKARKFSRSSGSRQTFQNTQGSKESGSQDRVARKSN